jgi:hypothetical protein
MSDCNALYGIGKEKSSPESGIKRADVLLSIILQLAQQWAGQQWAAVVEPGARFLVLVLIASLSFVPSPELNDRSQNTYTSAEAKKQ